MKKIFLIALAAAVVFCMPLTAMAKADFELGGFIRLDALWNSQTALGHTLAGYSPRSNVVNANHGAFFMNANATRFNLTMKGPELWGGKVTGFIEVDFDGANVATQGRAFNGDLNNWTAVNDSQFVQAKLRLRHAMFKVVWPDREVLLGQFWSVNSELIPETADSGGYCLYGATQFRVPQVRYTQKFTDSFNASLAIAHPTSGRWGINVDATNPSEGETSETPMVEAKLRFEQDLYGKAGWYGKPRAFYVGFGGGWFRTRNVTANFDNAVERTGPAAASITRTNTWGTLGNNNYFTPTTNIAAGAANIGLTDRLRMAVSDNRYHDHWLILIENFTPIIPTTTKSLAGTLGFAHQWWIGQGVSAWRLDLPGSDRYYTYTGNAAGANNFNYDLQFIKRFGGWAQLQYYFTEQIYSNINFGFEQGFGFHNNRQAAAPGGFGYANPLGYDPVASVWRVGVTQWYRPVSAVKFALQYSYMQTNYFQATSNVGVGQNNQLPVNQSNRQFNGGNHSIFANAWYMF